MTDNYQVLSGTDLGLAAAFRSAGVGQIHVQGDVAALEGPLIALVGTRHPNGDGLAMARRLAEIAVANKYVVLSGGALGIDAAVHLATLSAGGRTVVVLPSGLDRPYPSRHRGLYEKIVASGGALVSPFRADTPPTKWTFAKRNGVVAALCQMLVVIQAPASSGALIAADMATKMGRRVFAVPSAPNDRRGAGCLALLRRGAELCGSVSDLQSALEFSDGPLLQRPDHRPTRQVQSKSDASSVKKRGVNTEHSPPANKARVDFSSLGLDPIQRQCVEAITGAPKHPDLISQATGISSANVRAALMTLVLLGVVTERTDGRFAVG